MRISRTAHAEGNILLVVETRWSSNNAMVDYGSAKENAASVIEKHADLLVPGTLQTHRLESVGGAGSPAEAPNRMYDRLALALFVPLGVLAFALVAIYGLSRIYLALPTAGASIMAILVALSILGICAYFVSNPGAPRWQWLGVAVVGIAALGIGGTVAGIYDENNKEVHVPETPGPGPGEPTPPGPGGPASIVMTDNAFDQTALTIPAGEEVVIDLRNDGSAVHNVQVAVSGSYSDGTCARGSEGCSDPNSIRGGQSGTLTLNLAAGTYDFRCDFHVDQMNGTITAQ